jgi:glutamine synthetase
MSSRMLAGRKAGAAGAAAASKLALSEPVVLSKAKEAIELCRKQNIRIVDLKFVDLFGTWQHVSITSEKLTESLFLEGSGFDGSSIRGFQAIHESDMLIVPDPTTAVVDPVCEVPTLSMVCDIYDPITKQPYPRDPRGIARRAEAYLRRTGIADVSYWGPEVEFFVFENVRFDSGPNFSFYEIDSDDGIWNSGRERNGKPNLGYRPRHKEGYFPVPPTDSLQDFRSRAVTRMLDAGLKVEIHHHEVSTAGQCEIDMRFDSLMRMGDHVQMYKDIQRNVAAKEGKSVTFMPKPLFGDNGSGMHVHQSLWKKGVNRFFDPKGYAGTSELCRWYIGGLLKHSPALLAIIAPTTNSYRRLVPGYEAPVNLVYSKRNRSAAVRIPMYSEEAVAKRLEFRVPDPSANPYLTFAALLMAGLDGIQNRIDPGEPLEKDIYDLPPAEAAKIAQVPGSLADALDALERDHSFLLKGDVFPQELIETWISLKRTKEVDAVRLRPHPHEFAMYYDV